MEIIAPTVESIGDEALTNSIIDRSITELQDNIVTELGANALCGCSNLKKAVFGAATSMKSTTFDGCTSLETLDFYDSIPVQSLEECTSLTALILRGDDVRSLAMNSYLENTPIYNGAGYIYVPAALVDSYKVKSGWRSYADQIRAIEDYPEVCDPYSWEAVAANIENGTYKSVYKVGDCVPVDLGSEGIINMEIVAFDADTLADGSGTAAISWVAKELLATFHRMNPPYTSKTEGTGTIGGWEKCEMRTYLNNTIKPLFPENVACMIQSVAKTHQAYDTSGSKFTQTTHDDLWLLSSPEWISGIYSSSSLNKQASRIKYRAGASSPSKWWGRYGSATNNYIYVKTDGGVSSDTSANSEMGVCIGFCTGRTPA